MIRITFIILCLFLQACSAPPRPPGMKSLSIVTQNYAFKETLVNKSVEGSEPYNIWFAPNNLITNKYNQRELKFIHDGTWKNYSLCYSDNNGASLIFLSHSTNYLWKSFTVVDSNLSSGNREYRIMRIP